MPGPQTLAYESPADILFYGGAAGGGKTDLLLGLAHHEHYRSIIFRREAEQLKGIIDRSREMLQPYGTWRFNGQSKTWRNPYEQRIIELAGVKDEDSKLKYQGRPHGLKAFDELPNFLESQFRFLIGWKRSVHPWERKRVVAAGNPPTDAEGEWVIRYWGPWLDNQHSNPAKPGELRWFVAMDGQDVEVESGAPFYRNKELILPESRTFIPARLTDNPFLLESGYMATLQAMPEPLRSQMLYGDFLAGIQDDAWQVIPTEWIRKAQARWTPQRVDRYDALGVDVSRGGNDKTVIAPRKGAWFDELRKFAGASTPDGQAASQHIDSVSTTHLRENIDVIGVGASVYDLRKENKRVHGVNAAAGSDAMDKSEQLSFVNLRAEMWWKFREALDPDYGDDIALPPDRELLSDLTAPKWKMTPRGIQIEGKEDIKKRIGRSPDCGDAVVMAWYIPPDATGFAYSYDPRTKRR